jgi:tetratricopeptide (TPR) repeat protein
MTDVYLYILLTSLIMGYFFVGLALQRRRRVENSLRMVAIHGLITEGKIEEAAAAVTAAAAKSRYREPASQYQLALLFMRLKKYQEAVDQIDRLGHLEEPAAGVIFRVRHAALMALGRTAEAVTMLEETDRSHDSLEWRASWLMHTPQRGYLDDQHMLVATELLAASPADPLALSIAARGALDRRRWDEAAGFARQLIDVSQAGQLAHPRLQLGGALFVSGHVTEAEAQFALIREGGASELAAEIERWKILMLLWDGRFNEALMLARQLVRDRPDEALSHLMLAEALWRTGDLDGAERENHAAQKDGYNEDSRRLESLILADRGRAQEALELAAQAEDPTRFCTTYVRCKFGLAGAEEALLDHIEAIPTDIDNEILLALPAPGGGTWGDRITA